MVELAGPGYRQIVLRALPNLKKLDNVDVSPEEVAEAMRAPVAQPQQRHEVYENPSPPPPVQHQQTSPQQQQQQYRQQSPVIEVRTAGIWSVCDVRFHQRLGLTFHACIEISSFCCST